MRGARYPAEPDPILGLLRRLHRLPPPARNIALTEPHNLGQGIVATCAACRLSTGRAAENLHADDGLLEAANTALAAPGLKLKNETPIKHMAEVLIEDIGYEAIGEKLKKPLEGITMAGEVGSLCVRLLEPGDGGALKCTDLFDEADRRRRRRVQYLRGSRLAAASRTQRSAGGETVGPTAPFWRMPDRTRRLPPWDSRN